MSISRNELNAFLANLLTPEKIKDYCPNGLQVEGAEQIERIVTGVTASQALIDASIEAGADALLVHHGYFWKGENPVVTGMKKRRLQALLQNDINLFAYHLPLDVHPTLGNNAQLAQRFDIKNARGLELGNPFSVAMQGEFEQKKSIDDIISKINSSLGVSALVEKSGPEKIKTVAWCSGGGQGYIEQAAEQNIDLFITGEVSEQTIHTARECGIHFIAAGHHATERYGAKALGEYIAQHLPVDVTFIDIPNPA
ncbi:Nif3-like dinuclear metal center hexameric protein [Aestuariibacter sp. AA17]|uniref:Nif3-like dinuclear metal center hexameric protein n=1 Tax=Fluctibacter corallii TaxID=2984329 RepID=A0ABT3A9K4_9ALTE|nr:Nif3-like dinuclear metal center hexameric protein [Aestuariibacter sp. AA17]MCV2885353.1 Nif3-like dinuclear metal center hexameric protein [Aestuariibacter sp. AA17]